MIVAKMSVATIFKSNGFGMDCTGGVLDVSTQGCMYIQQDEKVLDEMFSPIMKDQGICNRARGDKDPETRGSVPPLVVQMKPVHAN